MTTFLIGADGNQQKIKIKFTLEPKFFVLDDDRPITENIDYSSNVMGTYYHFRGQTTKRVPGCSLGKRVVYYLKPTNIKCQDPEFDVKKLGMRFNYQV